MPDIAQKYKKNRAAHDKAAREWTGALAAVLRSERVLMLLSVAEKYAMPAKKPLEKAGAKKMEVITID